MAYQVTIFKQKLIAVCLKMGRKQKKNESHNVMDLSNEVLVIDFGEGATKISEVKVVFFQDCICYNLLHILRFVEPFFPKLFSSSFE